VKPSMRLLRFRQTQNSIWLGEAGSRSTTSFVNREFSSPREGYRRARIADFRANLTPFLTCLSRGQSIYSSRDSSARKERYT